MQLIYKHFICCILITMLLILLVKLNSQQFKLKLTYHMENNVKLEKVEDLWNMLNNHQEITCLIDIGGFAGAMAKIAVGKGKNVFIIEPTKADLNIIYRWISNSQVEDLVQVFPYLLSNETSDGFSMQFHEMAHIYQDSNETVGNFSVKSMTLLDLLPFVKSCVAFMKIALQGNECYSFNEKTAEFFREVQVPFFVMEWNMAYRANLKCKKEMVKMFGDFGYQPHYVNGSLVPKDVFQESINVQNPTLFDILWKKLPHSYCCKISNESDIKIMIGNRTFDLVWCPTLHLYRINGKPLLWVFWDKKPLPVHIRLSLATIICHNQQEFHIQIVSEEQLSAWIDVHPAYQFLIPAHKADYFRGHILAKYGGVYMDADAIGLHNFKHLFMKLKDFDIVNIDWPPDGDEMSVGVIGPMRANTTLMSQFVDKQDAFLTSKLPDLRKTRSGGQYPIRWAEMLRELLMPLVKQLLNETAYRYYKMNGVQTFGQLIYRSFNPSAQLNATQQYTFMDTELLLYFNSVMGVEVRNMTEQQFLQSNMSLPTLVRFTMKRCKDNNFKDFPLEAKLTIGDDEEKIDKNLVKWIIDYTNKSFFH